MIGKREDEGEINVIFCIILVEREFCSSILNISSEILSKGIHKDQFCKSVCMASWTS